MKERRREKGREEGEGEEPKRYGSLDFCMGFGFVRISKGLYEFLACSKPRVLLGDHPNPRIVKVVWVNNSWYKINMESILFLWFYMNWWTLVWILWIFT